MASSKSREYRLLETIHSIFRLRLTKGSRSMAFFRKKPRSPIAAPEYTYG